MVIKKSGLRSHKTWLCPSPGMSCNSNILWYFSKLFIQIRDGKNELLAQQESGTA